MSFLPTILDKIVGTLYKLMSKFHVPCKNVVHPLPQSSYMFSSTLIWGERGMAPKNASKEKWAANNGKLRQTFTPGVPRTFDQDCSKLFTALLSKKCSN